MKVLIVWQGQGGARGWLEEYFTQRKWQFQEARGKSMLSVFEKQQERQCGWVEQNWKQNNPEFSPKFDTKFNI